MWQTDPTGVLEAFGLFLGVMLGGLAAQWFARRGDRS